MAKYISEVGSFLCQVVEPQAGWLGESKEKGTPFIRIHCVVNDPESSQHGCEITYNAYLSDGAVDRTVKDLKEVFGWDGDLESLVGGEGFTGMECVIVTEADNYDGKTQIKAKYLNSKDRVAPTMAKEKVSSLISRLNSRTKAVARAATSTAPAKPAATPAATTTKPPF